MIYKQATIDKIREVYPLREDLIDLAIDGSEVLPTILDELSQEIITPFEICKAFESTRKEDVRNLYDRAKSSMKREEVYNMAMEDFYQSFSPENTSEDESEERAD
jgi:hypothetical protein